ncbi:MAG: ABC transporter permease subunit [Erysipelotrichales bacterium]|nr:ABC transporter permease subunit [Erysipelotrichales bacterium]
MSKNSFLIIGSILLFYLLFLLGSVYFDNQIIFPRPNQVLSALFQLFGELRTYQIFGMTFLRLAVSLLISFVLAFILALLSYLSDSFLKLIRPIILFFRSIPVVAIIVIIWAMFGDIRAPYVITTLMVFPIIYQALYQGLKNIRKDYLEVYSLDSGLTPLVFKLVYLPLMLPFIKTAFFQALGLGIKITVMSEFLVQSEFSIGSEIWRYRNLLSFDFIFAWVIILVLIIASIEYLAKSVLKSEN